MKVIRNNHHKSHEVNSALLPYYNDKQHLLDHGVASFAYDHWRNETNKTDFRKIWISVATLF